MLLLLQATRAVTAEFYGRKERERGKVSVVLYSKANIYKSILLCKLFNRFSCGDKQSMCPRGFSLL